MYIAHYKILSLPFLQDDTHSAVTVSTSSHPLTTVGLIVYCMLYLIELFQCLSQDDRAANISTSFHTLTVSSMYIYYFYYELFY